jgi:hypothetical protein
MCAPPHRPARLDVAQATVSDKAIGGKKATCVQPRGEARVFSLRLILILQRWRAQMMLWLSLFSC